MQTVIFTILSILCIGIVIVLLDRKFYKHSLNVKRLKAADLKYPIGEKFWYNSAKDLNSQNFPSSWAKVVEAPYLHKGKLMVAVVLKVPGQGTVDANVIAESLTAVSQLNS